MGYFPPEALVALMVVLSSKSPKYNSTGNYLLNLYSLVRIPIGINLRKEKNGLIICILSLSILICIIPGLVYEYQNLKEVEIIHPLTWSSRYLELFSPQMLERILELFSPQRLERK